MKPYVAAIALLFVTMCTGIALGELFFFDGNGNDNLWTNEENWSPVGIPGELDADVVVARSANGKRVLIDDSMEVTVDFLTMWGGTDSQIPDGFDMTGGVLELAGASGLFEMGSNEVNIPIEVNMTGGFITATNAFLGGRQTGGGTPPIDSDAVFNVSGDADIVISGFLQVGHDHPDALESMGTLNLFGEAIMTLGSLIVSPEGNGLITVREDAQLLVAGDVAFEIEEHIDSGRVTGLELLVEYLEDDDLTSIVATGRELRGDFDGNGSLDLLDVNDLIAGIVSGNGNGLDLSNDGTTDEDDLRIWIKELKNSWFGDANLDGEFNSGDLVAVFTAGEYEDGMEDNSTWNTGDWNADGDFTSGDIVFAFSDGGYELGPRADVNAVPEPTSFALLIAGLVVMAQMADPSGRTRLPFSLLHPARSD